MSCKRGCVLCVGSQQGDGEIIAEDRECVCVNLFLYLLETMLAIY